MDSGSGSVGRVVASNTRYLLFEPSHKLNLFTLNFSDKTKLKKTGREWLIYYKQFLLKGQMKKLFNLHLCKRSLLLNKVLVGLSDNSRNYIFATMKKALRLVVESHMTSFNQSDSRW